MTIFSWILFGLLCATVALCLWLGVRHALQKGPLLNNAYLYASAQERQQMDKATHYRQSAVIFFGVALIFACCAIDVLLRTAWFIWVILGLALALIVYAIISSVSCVRKL